MADTQVDEPGLASSPLARTRVRFDESRNVTEVVASAPDVDQLISDILPEIGDDESNFFELNDLMDRRDAIFDVLAKDPIRFANTLYSEKSKSFFGGSKQTFSPYFDINTEQLCCLTSRDEFDLDEAPDVCVISTVDRLIKKGSTETFNVKLPGEDYILKKRILKSLSIKSSTDAPVSLRGIRGKDQFLQFCGYPDDIKDLVYVGSDVFTNEVLVSILVNKIYDYYGEPNGLSGYTRHYGSSICEFARNRYGLNFIEYANYGNIPMFIRDFPEVTSVISESQFGTFRQSEEFVEDIALSDYTIIDMVKQVVSNLHLLQTYGQFNHGSMTVTNVVVRSEAVQFEYNGVQVNSRFKYMISDYGYSAVSINLEQESSDIENYPSGYEPKFFRFYNRSGSAEKILTLFPFKPSVEIDVDGVTFTVDSPAAIDNLSQIRHLGIPYHRSWDTMTFLVSLLMLPEVFYTVFRSPYLKSVLWDSIVPLEDSSVLYKDIKNSVIARSEPNITNVVRILKGRKIKCNMTDLLLANLSS
jgi:hypothetical protein